MECVPEYSHRHSRNGVIEEAKIGMQEMCEYFIEKAFCEGQQSGALNTAFQEGRSVFTS